MPLNHKSTPVRPFVNGKILLFSADSDAIGTGVSDITDDADRSIVLKEKKQKGYGVSKSHRTRGAPAFKIKSHTCSTFKRLSTYIW
jgi:hypothetical protein